MRILFFTLLCTLSISVNSEIYKTVDEKGNVIYTDIKPKDTDSEEVKLKPITPIENIPARKVVSTRKNSEESDEPERYSSFQIIKPVNGATIRNKQSFAVQLSVLPRLLTGHTVRLLLDGEMIETKRGLLFTLQDVERGAHTITAELLDAGRKVIKSNSHTVYVHRTISSP